jgi:hypothetical protein
MSLSQQDVLLVRAELGHNLLDIGALPFIRYVSLFDQIVGPYMNTGTATTSSTAVTAASTPTAVTLTLASATGFAAGNRVIIDVDSLQEEATVRSVSGSTIGVILSFAHTGTYPVAVMGGVEIVRRILKDLVALKTQLLSVVSTAGLKRAEDIEWYQSQGGAFGGSAQLGALFAQRDDLRDQLAAACGMANGWRLKSAGSTSSALY